MKCRTCGYEIPSGKNYCPGCGRVLSKIEQEQNQPQPQTQYTQQDAAPTYRRPVAADNSGLSENIKAIFTGDTDAPEYHDPHIYKSATAHALEYDKTFVQRSTARQNPVREDNAPYNEDEVDDMSATMEFRPVNRNYEVETEQDNYDYDYEEDAEDNKQKKKFRPGLLFMCIAVAAGLAFIIFCTYGIGSHFGIWGGGGAESSSDTADGNYVPDEKAPIVNIPPSTANNNDTFDYKIGTYTINTAESNALLYKHSSLDQIIATIPNLTVIEITEIVDESGKCKFGDYTGWLDMKLLLYTPNAKLPEETTTQEETSSAGETTTLSADETTTQETTTAATYTTGTYTVDLKGDGNVLNVRDAASINANSVSQITDGTVVTVSQVSGDWGYITTSDGTSGWVYMVYLR